MSSPDNTKHDSKRKPFRSPRSFTLNL